MDGARWVWSPALQTVGSALYALGGCVLTGFALGFGSKFWHDLLGMVFELRKRAKQAKSGAKTEAGDA